MARSKEDYRTLSGPQNAAMLMLSLDDEYSTKMFALMDDEEIKEFSQTMANLGTVNASVAERLFAEFAGKLSATGSLFGSMEITERLLLKSMPKERVDQILEDIRGPAGRTMWEKLNSVNELVLANYLKNEYPQTVAVIMTKINVDHAARVLSMLPENFSIEVIMRMLRMEAVQKEVLDHVERTLRAEFMLNLARVDAGGIQILLRHAEKEKLAIALKGAGESIRICFSRTCRSAPGGCCKRT